MTCVEMTHPPLVSLRRVGRVARRYLYTDEGWPVKVDRSTGRSVDTHPQFEAFTADQFEVHKRADEAHEVIAAAGVANRIGGRLQWPDEDVIEFAEWLRERGLT